MEALCYLETGTRKRLGNIAFASVVLSVEFIYAGSLLRDMCVCFCLYIKCMSYIMNADITCLNLSSCQVQSL